MPSLFLRNFKEFIYLFQCKRLWTWLHHCTKYTLLSKILKPVTKHLHIHGYWGWSLRSTFERPIDLQIWYDRVPAHGWMKTLKMKKFLLKLAETNKQEKLCMLNKYETSVCEQNPTYANEMRSLLLFKCVCVYLKSTFTQHHYLDINTFATCLQYRFEP